MEVCGCVRDGISSPDCPHCGGSGYVRPSTPVESVSAVSTVIADTPSLDRVFSWLSQDPEQRAVHPAAPDHDATPAERATEQIVQSTVRETVLAKPNDGTRLPPEPRVAVTPESIESEKRWLLTERAHFDSFCVSQLQNLRKQRQELLDMQTRAEAWHVAQCQEVNRRQAALESWSAALNRREAQCAAVENSIRPRMDELTAAEQQRAALQAQVESVGQQLELQQQVLAEVKGQTESAQLNLDEVRREYDARQVFVRARMAEESHWLEQRARWEDRMAEVERAEELLRRRAAEVEALEEDIREDLERRERELGRRENEFERRQRVRAETKEVAEMLA